MKTLTQLGKSLSRNEQKKVVGGVIYYQCLCFGANGHFIDDYWAEDPYPCESSSCFAGEWADCQSAGGARLDCQEPW